MICQCHQLKDLFHLGGRSTQSVKSSTLGQMKTVRQRKENSALSCLHYKLGSLNSQLVSIITQNHTGWGWEEERILYTILFKTESVFFFKSKNGLRDADMCVGTWVCLSFGRERKRSALSGGKQPVRGPAFLQCDSFWPCKHSQTHACHFRGQIPLQACRIKGNSLGCTASVR